MEAANIEQLQKELERKAPEQVTEFVRIGRVKSISGLSKSTLLRWQKCGRFPLPVIHEGNTVLYDLAEVMAWRQAQFVKRAERAKAGGEQK